MQTEFKPAWWLPSPHLQTLWPALFRKRHELDYTTEQVELDDGDFLDLCWSNKRSGKIVLILHGLEGALTSHDAHGLFYALEQAGFRPVFMYFRGCSDRINRLARAYHSGETGDVAFIVQHINNRISDGVFATVGFSLGGNVLLKWLGETKASSPLERAVAVSVPFRLYDAAARLEYGLSKVYRNHLMKSLRQTYQKKFNEIKSPLKVNVDKLQSFWDYDDQVTAPLHGFSGAQEYYDTCSSYQFLKNIMVPTQIIHSSDDPFMFETTLPDKALLSDNIDLIATKHGGHVGFISGRTPFSAYSWCENKIIEFLKQ